MTYRQKLIARCAELGVIVHEQLDEVNLEAPAGFSFGDVHELVHSPVTGEQTKSDMWRVALADLKEHEPFLRPCEIPDCEWCSEEAQ